jgi:hypothetical protein
MQNMKHSWRSAAARNEIIHEGRLSTHEYAAPVERPLSRYAGPLFWKAERVLREDSKERSARGSLVWADCRA